MSKWQEIAFEEGAVAFSAFLRRLVGIKHAQDSSFIQAVSTWLEEVFKSQPLRARSYLIAQGATATCDDRVALVYNDMQKERIHNTVKNGQYDNKIPELVRLYRQIFRGDEIEKISHKIVKALPAVDEIEVHLALLDKVRKPLELDWTTKGMHFFELSGIKNNHINLAVRTVRQEENKFFPSLFSKSPVWLELVSRLEPELFDAMINKRNAEVTVENLKEEIDAEFQVFNLENAKQARRVAERRVLRSPDIEHQIEADLQLTGQEKDDEARRIAEEKILKNPDIEQKVDAALEAIKLEHEQDAHRMAERTVLGKYKIRRKIDGILERTGQEDDDEARRIVEEKILKNPDMKEQVDAALKAAKLEYDDDIRRIIEKKVTDKKQDEIYMQFTQDVLTKRGLANLLDKKWKEVGGAVL
jgi:hypothetical protein